jgi:serine/threonine protein kinase
MPRIFERGQLTGNTGTIVWFREQRIPSEVLSARIQAGTLSHHELLRLALHVSETLVAAEAVSIVHRDVKPANIIVDLQDEFWLIDFGVARHLDLESLTATAAPGGCGTIVDAEDKFCRNCGVEFGPMLGQQDMEWVRLWDTDATAILGQYDAAVLAAQEARVGWDAAVLAAQEARVGWGT